MTITFCLLYLGNTRDEFKMHTPFGVFAILIINSYDILPTIERRMESGIILIVVVLCCIFGIVLLRLFFQLKHDEDVKLIDANGIVIEKKNIGKGDFSFDLREGKVKSHFVMAGHRRFFDRIQIGDSLAKRPKSFFFDVYRKMDSSYQFVETIGYK